MHEAIWYGLKKDGPVTKSLFQTEKKVAPEEELSVEHEKKDDAFSY